MSRFEKEDKLAKLIHENHFLLPVINRFGIRLGFKDKTVTEVCAEKGIDENFFLSIVNTFSNNDYFPEESLLLYSPILIVDYLRKTHQYYFDYLFPELERRLGIVMQSCQGACRDLNIVKSFYENYKEELKKHVAIEEEMVFPYVIEVVNAFNENRKLENIYSIVEYEKDHTNVDQKIFDLKNIVIKYLDPVYKDNDCNAFLFALFQFERELIDHARIEDKILIPRIVELEKVVTNA